MTIDMQFRRWHEEVLDTYIGRTPGSASLFERGRRYLPGGDTRFSLTYRSNQHISIIQYLQVAHQLGSVLD